MEKILNKRKFREIMKYLVQWKWFTVKHDSWKREKDLENAKKVVAEFKESSSRVQRKVEYRC